MKTYLSILIVLLLLCSHAFAANPAFTDFYGTNGIIIRTNGNKVQVDGSALASSNILANANIWTNDNGRSVRLAGYPVTFRLYPTNLNANTPQIMMGGTNASNWFVNGFGGDAQRWALVSAKVANDGDNQRNNLSVAAAQDSAGNRFGIASLFTQTNFSYIETISQIGGLQHIFRAGRTGNESEITLTTNNVDAFKVDGAGGIVAMKAVTQNWPDTQGAFDTFLKNDGTGTLGWDTNLSLLSVTNLNVYNTTVVSNLNVKGDLIVTNITMGGANVRTNQYTTNISGTPVIGSFWFQGTNGAPVTNNARVALEWIPVMRSLRAGELGAQAATGPDGIYAASNYWTTTNVGFGSVAFGSNTMAQASYSTVLNGINNIILSNAIGSTIVGGSNNIIKTNAGFSVISGGAINGILGPSIFSTIGGGNDNEINAANYGTISGGFGHDIGIGSINATIGGGSVNVVGPSGQTATYSTIGGGRNNGIIGSDNTIAGGQGHSISGTSGTHNFIGGGGTHNINQSSIGATIAGGSDNDIGVTGIGAGHYGFIGGGQTQRINGAADYGTIGGGTLNLIAQSRDFGSILGGASNHVDAAAMASIVGNFITNTTSSSVEIGHGASGGNNRKLRVDVNGARVMTYNGSATVGGTYLITNTPIASAGAAETNLQVVTVGAHVLTNNNDRLLVRGSGNFAATSNTKQVQLVYGSEDVFDSGAFVANTGAWTLDCEIIRTGATAQSCNCSFNGGTNVVYVRTSALSTAQTNGIATVLKITGTAAGDGDITNRSMTVTWMPSP